MDERNLNLAAPEIAGLGDLDFVPVRLPDPDQPAAGPEPPRATSIHSVSVHRSADAPPRAARAAARPISTSRREPPHFQAMPSIRSRRRAPFGGGLPQAAAQACRRSAIDRPGKASIRASSACAAARHPRCRSRSNPAWIRPSGPGDRPCASHGGDPHVEALLAEPGDGGARRMRQPARGRRQVLERRPLRTRDRVQQDTQLAPGSRAFHLGVCTLLRNRIRVPAPARFQRRCTRGRPA